MNFLNFWPFLVCGVLYAWLLYRFLENRLGKPIRSKATVVDKYYTVEEKFSNSQAPHIKPLYVVAFDVKKRVLKFEVPVWFYGKIEKGDEGILVYKGTRLINFEANEAN